MRTVLYFELRRKEKHLIKYIVFPIIFSILMFGICMAVDFFFPALNRVYMKWPAMLQDFLSLKPWSMDLWLNVWQLFVLVYPFYLFYVMMKEMSEALSEEERLETVVYLHNAGVNRKTIFATKLLVCGGGLLACCFTLLLLNVLFALLLGQNQGVKNAFAYYSILFFVGMLYLSVALFMAACKPQKGVAEDSVMAVLILPCLFSRIPALLRFFSELLVLTGRDGEIAERLGWLGERLDILTLLSPLTWSWPALKIQKSYIVCAIIMFVVMLGTAFSIYTHKKMR